MLDVALLHFQQDRTGLLQDRRRQPVLLLGGRPITEFGETRMVSSPRTNRTRPLCPVRMVSPGFKSSSCVSEACWAPDVIIQTSPDDLLTRQTSSSAAATPEAAARTKTAVRMREIPPVQAMKDSVCPQLTRRRTGKVSRLRERKLPSLGACLTIH
jgi:hypothetical protein